MTSPPFPADEKMIKHMQSRLGFGAYLGAKLPLAAFAGLRIDEFDAEKCAVSLPYGWRTQNPFQSIYFAAQCMAAELSTGALAMLAIQSSNESVAMLVTNMEASFGKKATERSTFLCTDGLKVFEAIDHTIKTGEGVTVDMHTIGTMPNGEQISEFTFQWSFKKRSRKK